MPRLIRFMLASFRDGAVMGLAVALGVMRADVGSIGRLLEADASGGLLCLLVFAQAALLFGTLAMAVAVMNLGQD